MMPMIFFSRRKKSRYGSTEKELTIQIPMEQAVPYLPQLHQILQKEETWKPLSGMQKNYISGALADMLDLGKGSGPMNHAFAIEGEYER